MSSWWCVPRMVKTWKRHRGPSKPTHHPCPCLPYMAPGGLLRGNRKITFHSGCHTHPASHQPSPGFPTALHKPLDVIAPPQVPKGFPGNATATDCNRGQQSVDLSLSGGRPQRLQCWGSSGWPVIFRCSLNPFTYSLSPGRICFYFHTERDMCSACSDQFRTFLKVN